MSFLAELRRRNVVRVGIAYVVASWLILQLTEVLTGLLDVSTDVGKIVIILLIVGFIPTLIIAWAYELTPEGLKRDKEVVRDGTELSYKARRLDFFIIVVLVIALGYFIVDEYQDSQMPDQPIVGSQAVGDASEQAIPDNTDGAVAGDAATAPAASPAEPSIAVLPFSDMSAEGDQEYFSDGIAEELLNLLVRVDGLKVASRTSSFAFKNTGRSIGDIAGELGVNHILEGSVRKADNRVRITAQLIDSKTDRHLWSETYDRELNDIFAIQDDIANAIVTALQQELGMLDDAKIEVEAATESLDAYELFLQANALFIARNQLPNSINLFEQAVALDPEFARAWEGLAAVYSVAPSWDIRDRDYIELAEMAANTALALKPDLSLAWAVKGQYQIDRHGNLMLALDNFEQALLNDPRNSTAYLWRALNWFLLGFIDKALMDTQRCLDIDPRYLNCQRHHARFLLANGQSDAALEMYSDTIEKGFFASDPAFLQLFIERGDRTTAAYAIWFWNLDNRTYPASMILDALENPDHGQSERFTRFMAWREQNQDDYVTTEIYVILGAYDLVLEKTKQASFDENWIWESYAEGFRRSPYFKLWIEKVGLHLYWFERGFPPQCRPVGENDFECDP